MHFVVTDDRREVIATHSTAHPNGMKGEAETRSFQMDPGRLMVAADGQDPNNPELVRAANRRLVDAVCARARRAAFPVCAR